MCPMTQYPILQTLLSPFRRSQQKTLTLVIAALAEVAQKPPHSPWWVTGPPSSGFSGQFLAQRRG